MEMICPCVVAGTGLMAVGWPYLMLLCRRHHRAVHEGEAELPALE